MMWKMKLGTDMPHPDNASTQLPKMWCVIQWHPWKKNAKPASVWQNCWTVLQVTKTTRESIYI